MTIAGHHKPGAAAERPAGAWSKHTHAPDAGRGMTLCGKRGAPVGAAPTCANCRRALAARERRDAIDAAKLAEREPAPIPGRPPAKPDAMRAAGWKRRPGDAKGWRPE